MERGKAMARRHPVWYCIAAETLFLVILTAAGNLIQYFGREENFYVLFLMQEAVGTLAAWGLLAYSGLLTVLKNRGSGLGRGLLVGGYLVFISIYTAVMLPLLYEGEKTLQAPYLIAVYVACMVCVGIAEEFIFRGIIATLLLRKFGLENCGIRKAVVLSGVLFGVAHISNIAEGSPVGVLVQAVIASMLGMLLSAIYYRTGCVWVTVVLHAIIDISAGITTGLFGNETLVGTISSYSVLNLLSCIPYLVVLMILLRKKKLEDVRKNMAALMD